MPRQLLAWAFHENYLYLKRTTKTRNFAVEEIRLPLPLAGYPKVSPTSCDDVMSNFPWHSNSSFSPLRELSLVTWWKAHVCIRR